MSSAGTNLIKELADTMKDQYVAITLLKSLSKQLADKGVTGVPQEIATPQQVEAAIRIMTEKKIDLPDAEDHSVTVNALTTTQDETNRYRKERQRQASAAFNMALVSAIIGVLIIFAGVILLFTEQNVTSGAITAGIGAVSEIVGLLLFKLSYDANGRFDEVGRDLGRMSRAKEAAEIAMQIGDSLKRDEVLKRVAESLGESQEEA